MERTATRWLGAALGAALLVACGGATSGDPSEPDGAGGDTHGSGGSAATGGGGSSSGGAQPSTGGAGPALPDCRIPVATGTPCSEPNAHCGGPCSNSWQVENICRDGLWEYADVVACGPDASHAPQCKNSFSSGALTPCCPTDSLDCTGKPDGYPGFGCTPGDGSFCSCTCYGGSQVCGC